MPRKPTTRSSAFIEWKLCHSVSLLILQNVIFQKQFVWITCTGKKQDLLWEITVNARLLEGTKQNTYWVHSSPNISLNSFSRKSNYSGKQTEVIYIQCLHFLQCWQNTKTRMVLFFRKIYTIIRLRSYLQNHRIFKNSSKVVIRKYTHEETKLKVYPSGEWAKFCVCSQLNVQWWW